MFLSEEIEKSAEVSAYIAKVKSVSVNGTLYNRINYSEMFMTQKTVFHHGYRRQQWQEECDFHFRFENDRCKDKVIVQAEGYNDLVLSYPSTASRVGRSLLEDPFLEELSDREEEKREEKYGRCCNHRRRCNYGKC